MKKLFLAVAAVAMVFATSCKKENINGAEEPAGDNEFVCVIDQNANPQNAPRVDDGMGTLAHIDNSNNVWWQEGDQIAYYGTENTQGVGRYVLTCSKMSDNRAYFSATGQHFGQGAHEAYYPASIMTLNNQGQKVLTLPSAITLEANKNAAQLPMIGTGNGTHYLTFHNICAVLKITIPSFLNGASRFELSSDKAMNGAFTINNNTAVMSATSPTAAQKKITVQKSSGTFATNEVVYVAVPAQTYNTLKIEFFNNTGSVLTKSVTNKTFAVSKVYPIGVTQMTHQYVDLGLSVKWATCNIGANNPWYYGFYYAWGETTSTKSNYDLYSYDFYSASPAQFSKYGVDGRTVLESCDDAATANWGSNWRMPTEAEWNELINNCTWTWITYNSVNGYRVTSKITGYTDKSIFLPAAKFYQGTTFFTTGGEIGAYWTSTHVPISGWMTDVVVYDNTHTPCQYVYFSGSTSPNTTPGWRWFGLSVRPVCP